MRFYTAEINGKEEILVCFWESEWAHRLSRLAKLNKILSFNDMNDLIDNYTDEVDTALTTMANNADVLEAAAVNINEVKLLSSIDLPK